MPRSSLSYDLISDAALGSLAALGTRLKEARLLRNWTQADAATKAGLSESSIRKVEAGSPHITVGAYAALLDVFGLPTGAGKDMSIARCKQMCLDYGQKCGGFVRTRPMSDRDAAECFFKAAPMRQPLPWTKDRRDCFVRAFPAASPGEGEEQASGAESAHRRAGEGDQRLSALCFFSRDILYHYPQRERGRRAIL